MRIFNNYRTKVMKFILPLKAHCDPREGELNSFAERPQQIMSRFLQAVYSNKCRRCRPSIDLSSATFKDRSMANKNLLTYVVSGYLFLQHT